MRNLELEIINCLVSRKLMTFEKIYEKVGNNRTKLYNECQRLVKENVLIKTTVGLRLNEDVSSPELKGFVKSYMKTANLYLKQLRKTKPLFKNITVEKTKDGGTMTTYWVNPKGRPIVENYIKLIDELASINSALMYHAILTNKSTNTSINLIHDQKIFFKTMRVLVTKLRSRYYKDLIALDNFMYWNSSILRRIGSMNQFR